MTRTDYRGYSLLYHLDYIEIIFHHGSHFNEAKFLNCFEEKLLRYQHQKIGVLVTREDVNATYSFDPMLLLYHHQTLEAHAHWIVVVSNDEIDRKNLTYVSQFTKLPCTFTNTKEKAFVWIEALKKD